MQSNQIIKDQEEIVESKQTGEKIWLLTTKMPFRDSQGQIAGIIGIGRNITDRKRLEEETVELLENQYQFRSVIVRRKSHFLLDVNMPSNALKSSQMTVICSPQ